MAAHERRTTAGWATILVVLLWHCVASQRSTPASYAGGGGGGGDSCRCQQTTVECSARADARNSIRSAFMQCIRSQNGQTTQIQLRNAGLVSLDLFSSLSASYFGNLRVLDLRGNRLTSVNGTALIQLAPQLQNLSLSGNLLREFPRFALANRLIHLSLSRNQIETLASWVAANLTSLRSLDLSNNDITELPAHLFNQNSGSALIELNLSNNRIVNPCNLTSLNRLEALRLSGNEISQLSRECFAQLPNLRVLDLSRNDIQTIEGLTFKSLASLNTLILRQNRIATLQDGAFFFQQFDTLERLELDFNEITSVEGKWLYSLGQLKALTLSHNRISRICDGAWDFTKQLVELDLKYNDLQTLDADRFKGLLLLQRLALSDNRLSTIDRDAFAGLSSLQYLDLSNNNLTLADDPPFSDLRYLRALNVSNNSISLLSAAKLAGIRDSLHSLSLLENPLRIVMHDSFRSLRNLESLQLSSSELVCDCGLIDFVGWFKQFVSVTPNVTARRQIDVVALCGYPDSLRGLNVFDLSVDELRCDSVTRPTLIREPEAEVKAVRFRNLTLECVAQVSDDARDLRFGWLKDNEPVTNTSKIQIEVARLANNAAGDDGESEDDFPQSAFATRFVTVRSTLNFRYVDYVDAGTYQCVVQTGGATAFETRSRRVSVRVHVAPQLTVMPQSATVRLGDTAKLECAARGDPPATISWNKDGNRDFPAARERRIQFVDRDTALLIVDVREADAGVYTCVASNLVGRVSANASLRISDAPPRFIEPLLTDVVVNHSGVAVLTCVVDDAEAEQRAELRWFFIPFGASTERELLLQSGVNSHYQAISSRQKLIVNDVSDADAGTYTCMATNSAGTRRQSARLVIATVAADWRDGAQTLTHVEANSLPRLPDFEPPEDEFDEEVDEQPARAKARATEPPQSLTTITVSYEHVLIIVVCVCVVVTSCVWVFVFWVRARRARSAARKRSAQAKRLLLAGNVQSNDENRLSSPLLSVSALPQSQSQVLSQLSPNFKLTPMESVEMMTKRSTDSDYVSSESHSNGNTSPTVYNTYDEQLGVYTLARQSPADVEVDVDSGMYRSLPHAQLVHRPNFLNVAYAQRQTQMQLQQLANASSPLHDESPVVPPSCFGCVSTPLHRGPAGASERDHLSRSIPLQRRALVNIPQSQTLLTTLPLLGSSRSPSTIDCSIPHSMIQSFVIGDNSTNVLAGATASRSLLVHSVTQPSAASLFGLPHSQSYCRIVDRLTTGPTVGVGHECDLQKAPEPLAQSTSTSNKLRNTNARLLTRDPSARESVIWVENDQPGSQWRTRRQDGARAALEMVESSVDT